MTAEPAVPAVGVSRVVAGVAVAGALVLLGGLTATTQVVAAADVPTFVGAASAGAVLVVDGREVPVAEGDEVPDGARLRTGSGRAALVTGDRETLLGAGSTVRVLDGARQELEQGTALVDARDADGLQVAVEEVARVEVADGAVVRLESLPLLRVAAYRGAAAVRPAGRRSTTEVDALHQVRVPAGALPGRVTPLALVPGDAWEGRFLSAVVRDDVELTALEQELEAESEVVLRTLPAAQRASVDDGLSAGARALARALASDGTELRGDVFDAVREGRRLGGSWGVVVRLAGTNTGRAASFLELLMPVQVVQVALGDPATAGTGVLPFVPPADSGTEATAAPTRPAGSPRPTGTSSPTRPPSTSPSPTVPDVTGPVGTVVDTVRGLLPPAPSPVPTPAPTRTRAPLVDVELDVPLPLLD